MKKSLTTLAIALFTVILGSLPSRSAEPGLTPAEFDKLHQELSAAKEPWQSIPWKLSLVEAQTLAAKKKMPIYMLCRSGHPLGCV